LKKDNLADVSERSFGFLLYYLQQLRKQKAAEHSYEQGKQLNDVISYVNCQYARARRNALQRAAVEDYESNRNDLEAALRAFEAEEKRQFAELEEELAREKERLKEEHEAQAQEHLERWNSAEKCRQYNRASNALTVLQKQHAQLLIQCRFEDAQAVNRLREARMHEEQAIQHAMHEKDFEESAKYLAEKQAAEDQFFEAKKEVQIAQFKRRKALERRVLENKEKKIEVKGKLAQDAEKLWNLAQVQRLEDLCDPETIRESEGPMPSSKMTKRDLQDPDVVILTLPPLARKTKSKPRKEKAP
jgi:hypothetical protein